MIVRSSSFVLCASLVLVVLPSTLVSSAAAQTPGTITVTGDGASSAWPNYAVLKGRISAGGETAADAVKAFRELRGKAEKLAKDDSKRLTVRFLGEELTQGGAEEAAMVAVAADTAVVDEIVGGQITVGEDIELRIDFAGDMERAQATENLAAVLDAAHEAGITFGSGGNPIAMAMIGQMSPLSIAEYRLADPATVEGEAYAAAVADARRKAEKLASLTGCKLGAVVAVEEEAGAAQSENPYLALISGMEGDGDKREQASSPANGRIQVQKSLRVSFAVERGGE